MGSLHYSRYEQTRKDPKESSEIYHRGLQMIWSSQLYFPPGGSTLIYSFIEEWIPILLSITLDSVFYNVRIDVVVKSFRFDSSPLSVFCQIIFWLDGWDQPLNHLVQKYRLQENSIHLLSKINHGIWSNSMGSLHYSRYEQTRKDPKESSEIYHRGLQIKRRRLVSTIV
jgi:hypothetical protein